MGFLLCRSWDEQFDDLHDLSICQFQVYFEAFVWGTLQTLGGKLDAGDGKFGRFGVGLAVLVFPLSEEDFL